MRLVNIAILRDWSEPPNFREYRSLWTELSTKPPFCVRGKGQHSATTSDLLTFRPEPRGSRFLRAAVHLWEGGCSWRGLLVSVIASSYPYPSPPPPSQHVHMLTALYRSTNSDGSSKNRAWVGTWEVDTSDWDAVRSFNKVWCYASFKWFHRVDRIWWLKL